MKKHEKNLRNAICPMCNSKKKFKNCCMNTMQLAQSIILLNQQRIKAKIREIANQMKLDYKMAGDTYTTTVIKDSRDSIFTYSVNGYPALKVDYKDIPLDINTVENAEKVAKVKPEDIVLEVIYKKPEIAVNKEAETIEFKAEIQEVKDADNGSN